MITELLAMLEALPPAAVYGVLFGGALLEYLFPPFPGDTVVLLGAALVAAFGWPLLPVMLAVTAGAVLGSALDLALGRWLLRTGRIKRMGPKKRKAVDLLVKRFERHGAVYLVLNRFMPGIRAAFFVAAGLAGLSTRSVLGWSTLSALAWNGLLVGAGLWMGINAEELAGLVATHNRLAGLVVAVVLVIVAVQTWRAVRGEEEREAAAEE